MAKYHAPLDYKPEIVLLFSGKRKSGKDFFVSKLLAKLDEAKTAVFRIAEPIKYHWAQKHNLDFEKLLDTSSYKEQHRFRMVEWSMEVRKENYGYFPVEALKMANAGGKPIWVCTDLRHNNDRKWLLEHYDDLSKKIKVTADPEIRKKRGWVFTSGVDDGPSECDQELWEDWDLVISNNGDASELDQHIKTILDWVECAT